MNESRQSKDLKKVRQELAKKISEATQQQEALGSGMKTDMGKLTADVLGDISNKDGLTTDVNGLKVNVSTLGTDLGKVASNMTKLESSIKYQNQQLQKSIANQMQNLFADFKTSIGETVRAEQTSPTTPTAQARVGDPSPTPRNVK